MATTETLDKLNAALATTGESRRDGYAERAVDERPEEILFDGADRLARKTELDAPETAVKLAAAYEVEHFGRLFSNCARRPRDRRVTRSFAERDPDGE